MNSYLPQYDKECMKMAILRHETIFKEQVHELHRLYQIQTLLMEELKREGLLESNVKRYELADEVNSDHQQCFDKKLKRPHMTIDLEWPAEDYDDGLECSPSCTEQETEIELTLGWGFTQRKKISPPSDSGPSFSSFTDSSTKRKENAVIPLKIFSREDLQIHDWGIAEVPDMYRSFSSDGMPCTVDAPKTKHPNQSSWRVHVLSLNMR